MGRAASTETEVKMVLEDSDLRNKIKAQKREIKTYEKLLEKMGREGKISFTKIEKGAGRAAKSIKGAGQSQKSAFGPSTFKQLAGVASGYIGVASAISGALVLMRRIKSEAVEAGTKLGEAEFGLGSLAELAGGDQEALAKLTAAAIKTFQEGGAKTLGEAASQVFQLESASILEARELAAKFFGIDAPGELVKGAGVLRASFGAEEAGSFQDIVSKSLAMAGPVTGVSAAQMALGTAVSGPLAVELGLKDEEIFAATSIIAQATGDAAQAGTKMVSLLNSLLEQGYGDRPEAITLREMLDEIRQLGLTKAELKPFFGRKEATFAFLKLGDEALRAREEMAIEAQATNLAERVVATAEAEPLVGISRLKRRQEGQVAAQKIPFGMRESAFQIGVTALEEAGRAAGHSEIRLSLMRLSREGFGILPVSKTDITNIIGELILRRSPDPEFISALKLMEDLTKRQAELLAILEAIGTTPTTTIYNNQKNTGVLIGGGQAGAKSSQNFHKDGDTG